MFLILMRTGPAFAGEEVSIPIGSLTPDFAAGPFAGRELMPLTSPQFDLPKTYHATDLAASSPYSPSEFRRRGHSLLERESESATPEDMPMLQGTSVWQRLADYRSHGRVRLLTLWETGGSSVSLQAGRKGEPSLQWTSRSMNHGGATHGLLDHLVSMAGANRNVHPAPRPSLSLNPSEASPRPGKPSEVGTASIK